MYESFLDNNNNKINHATIKAYNEKKANFAVNKQAEKDADVLNVNRAIGITCLVWYCFPNKPNHKHSWSAISYSTFPKQYISWQPHFSVGVSPLSKENLINVSKCSK